MRPFFPSLACCTLAALVSACDNNNDKPAGSVAARVNGDGITTEELKASISRGGGITPDQERKAAPRVLEQAINQQLLVQQAQENKLDRDPVIAQVIEASRKQILAQAYVEKITAGAGKVDAGEVRAFYASQPALFEQRRSFHFQELAVPANPAQVAALRTEAALSKSLTELAGWLKAQSLSFDTNTATKTADQLPIEMLPQIAQMKDGQIVVLPSVQGAAVLQLVSSQPASMTLEQATPRIEAFLVRKKRIEHADAEIAKLREKAKIEYVGGFDLTRPSVASVPQAHSSTTAGTEGKSEQR